MCLILSYTVYTAYCHFNDAGEVPAGLHIPTPCQDDTRSCFYSDSNRQFRSDVGYKEHQDNVYRVPDHGNCLFSCRISKQTVIKFNWQEHNIGGRLLSVQHAVAPLSVEASSSAATNPRFIIMQLHIALNTSCTSSQNGCLSDPNCHYSMFAQRMYANNTVRIICWLKWYSLCWIRGESNDSSSFCRPPLFNL